MAPVICADGLRLRAVYVVIALLVCAGCKKAQQPLSTAPASPLPRPVQQQARPVEPKIAACKLITSDEVGAIQGAKITDAKSSAGRSGNLLMSQCYYASIEPNKSVSVAVIEKDPQSAESDPRRFWAEILAPFKEGAQGEDERAEKQENSSGEAHETEERKLPPKRIEGVGEEAFWNGNRFGGALYVLRTDVIIRISVGGPDNEEVKIEKSKTLAGKALARLP